jgi:hypothetical protein
MDPACGDFCRTSDARHGSQFQSEAVFREKNRFFAGNFAICDAA